MTADTNELRRKVNSTDIVDHIDLHANIKPFLSETIDRLEAAEKERDALRAENAALVDDMNLLRNNNNNNRSRRQASCSSDAQTQANGTAVQLRQCNNSASDFATCGMDTLCVSAQWQ